MVAETEQEHHGQDEKGNKLASGVTMSITHPNIHHTYKQQGKERKGSTEGGRVPATGDGNGEEQEWSELERALGLGAPCLEYIYWRT
jgi:hypothetical protein